MAVGDTFASPVVLTGTSGTAGIDNTGASYESGEPANDIGADGLASVWYEWTLPAGGWDVVIDTEATPTQGSDEFDSTLEVFTGSTLGSLTLLGSHDDIDYPTNPQSRVELSGVPGGTVLRIRVDGYAASPGFVGEVANGVLTYSATLAPSGPVPTLTSVTVNTLSTYDGYGTTVGEDLVELHGTNLSTVDAVTISGVTVSVFTVVSNTLITFLMVDNPQTSGISVHTSGLRTASIARTLQPLFWGPWIQPPDKYTTLIGGADFYEVLTFEDASTSSSYTPPEPDATHDGTAVPPTYVTSTSAGYFGVINEGDYDTGVEWHWLGSERINAVNVEHHLSTHPSVLAAAAPDSSITSDPDYWDYRTETTYGTVPDDTTVAFVLELIPVGDDISNTYDIDRPLTVTDVLDDSGRWYQLDSSDFHFDSGTGDLVLDQTWYPGTELEAKTLVGEIPLANDVEYESPTQTHWLHRTYQQDPPINLYTEFTVDWADRVDGGYAFLCTPRRLVEWDLVTLPNPVDVDHPTEVQQALKMMVASFGDPAIDYRVLYRPPRFRARYTTPQQIGGWVVGHLPLS